MLQYQASVTFVWLSALLYPFSDLRLEPNLRGYTSAGSLDTLYSTHLLRLGLDHR